MTDAIADPFKVSAPQKPTTIVDPFKAQTIVDPFKTQQIVDPFKTKISESPKNTTFLNTLAEWVFPSVVPPDPAKEAATGGMQILEDIPREMRRQQALASQEIRHGFGEATKGGLLHPALGALQVVGGGLNYLTAPLSGAARATIFNPISRATQTPEISEYGGMATDILATWPGAVAKGLGLLGLRAVPKLVGLGDVAGQIGAKTIGESVKSGALHGVERIFSPQTVTKESQAAGEVMVELLGRAANETAKSAKIFESYEKIVAKFTPEEGMNFIRSMLSGGEVTEELRPLQTALRTEIDKRQRQLVDLGILERFDEHYFPLVWKNPQKAEQLADAGTLARAGRSGSIGGAPGSLRHRTLSGIDEGLARGLELASTNPMYLASHMINEMDRFLAARRMVGEFERVGAARLIREGDAVPAGWLKIGDKLFGANYYAPPSVLRIFENVTTASGVQRVLGHSLYEGIRGFQNGMNRAQLSWPGFHFFFVNRDTVTSELARAVKMAAAGEFKEAAKGAARAFGDITPFGVATGIMKMRKGNQLREAMLEARIADPELQRIAEAAILGGARAGMDSFYKLTREGSFWKSLKEGWLAADISRTWKEAGLLAKPFKVLGRTLETISAPLMEYYIPRAKLGVFHGMASDWLKLNPHANPTELRAAMQRIWDSVDNRMGEMVYDNLFWSKTQKDIAYMTQRAVGFNLGTIRELGGAVFDTLRASSEVARTGNLRALQQGFTERMSYALAMPMMTMYHGAILTYMFTGKGPTSMLDYFFPPTGATLRNGVKERMSIPGYDKDVMEWALHPLDTAIGKLHPSVITAFELARNRDWSGASIYTPRGLQVLAGKSEGEIAQKFFTDMSTYFGEKFMPIGKIGELAREAVSNVTGAQFPRRRQEVAGDKSQIAEALKLIGMSPAPIKLTDPARAEMLELLYSALPAEVKHQRNISR